jgi:predicted RNase H-like nuclease (RuvC/YqgF family)
MGWLTDIFKDVPLTTELREKLAAIEAENDALKTDNVILKDDLREARAQILALEKKLEQFAHHSELDEADVLILKEVSLTSEPAASYLVTKLNLELAVVEFHLDRLEDLEYLSTWSIGGVERYSLEPKGRDYLIKKNLIT